MVKKIALAILFLNMFSSCWNKKQTDKDISLSKGVYLSNRNIVPFTGKMLSYMPNGNLSSETELRNGIPNGSWATFGFDGEFIQKGKMVQLILKRLPSNVYRITLNEFEEGNFAFKAVTIVVSDTVHLQRNVSLEEEIIQHIKNKPYNITGLVDIFYKAGELEEPILERSINIK